MHALVPSMVKITLLNYIKGRTLKMKKRWNLGMQNVKYERRGFCYAQGIYMKLSQAFRYAKHLLPHNTNISYRKNRNYNIS